MLANLKVHPAMQSSRLLPTDLQMCSLNLLLLSSVLYAILTVLMLLGRSSK
jgi:hypothetical protein